MKLFFQLFACVFLAFIGWVAYSTSAATSEAKAKATKFCASINNGQDVQSVISQAKSSESNRYYLISNGVSIDLANEPNKIADSGVVEFHSYMLCSKTCEFGVNNNKIVNKHTSGYCN